MIGEFIAGRLGAKGLYGDLFSISIDKFKSVEVPSSLHAPLVTSKGALTMCKLIQHFAKDESGATAIEYGLIAAGISVAIIVTVQGLGTKLTGVFSNVSSKL